jgi:hypothetical protein
MQPSVLAAHILAFSLFLSHGGVVLAGNRRSCFLRRLFGHCSVFWSPGFFFLPSTTVLILGLRAVRRRHRADRVNFYPWAYVYGTTPIVTCFISLLDLVVGGAQVEKRIQPRRPCLAVVKSHRRLFSCIICT